MRVKGYHWLARLGSATSLIMCSTLDRDRLGYRVSGYIMLCHRPLLPLPAPGGVCPGEHGRGVDVVAVVEVVVIVHPCMWRVDQATHVLLHGPTVAEVAVLVV